LQTVAEGVEDAVALQIIGELGVDFAQGYHIARPAPLGRPALSIASRHSQGNAAVSHQNGGIKP
jgi:EAL domain-containing protein (putative c-di-GMP-specific phosphodiesterase class I)